MIILQIYETKTSCYIDFRTTFVIQKTSDFEFLIQIISRLVLALRPWRTHARKWAIGYTLHSLYTRDPGMQYSVEGLISWLWASNLAVQFEWNAQPVHENKILNFDGAVVTWPRAAYSLHIGTWWEIKRAGWSAMSIFGLKRAACDMTWLPSNKNHLLYFSNFCLLSIADFLELF